jgi:hypothetical protein
MRLTTENLTILIASLEDYDEGSLENEHKRNVDLLKKMSKELFKRGYTTIISKTYLKD